MAEGVRVSACSSCGRAIIWTFSPNGARLPLDARPVSVYALFDTSAPTPQALATLHRPDREGDWGDGIEVEKVYVSHFVTCPNAAVHSKGARRG